MSAPPLRRLAERWRLLAFALGAAMGLFLLWSGLGDGADQGLRNLRAAWREHPASGEVHIVEIDDKSIAAFR